MSRFLERLRAVSPSGRAVSLSGFAPPRFLFFLGALFAGLLLALHRKRGDDRAESDARAARESERAACETRAGRVRRRIFRLEVNVNARYGVRHTPAGQVPLFLCGTYHDHSETAGMLGSPDNWGKTAQLFCCVIVPFGRAQGSLS